MSEPLWYRIFIGEILFQTCTKPSRRLLEWLSSKRQVNKCWWGCKEKGNPVKSWWEYKLMKPLWRIVWRLPQKLKIELPHDLPIHPKTTKRITQKDICIPMFLAAWFIIAKTWKQPKCPSGGEWIKRVWCTNNSGILLGPKKECNNATCDNQGAQGYYAKWNKSDR